MTFNPGEDHQFEHLTKDEQAAAAFLRAEQAGYMAFLRAERQQVRLRETLPEGMEKLATMFFTLEELRYLADLTEADLLTNHSRWSLGNSLRTALREAQYGLEPRS